MSVHFLLCDSCYWCASQTNNCNKNNIITECPSCKNNQIESMPISRYEVYNFSHNPKRGVTLGFPKSRS